MSGEKECFRTKNGEGPDGLSPLVLAYMGDAVYEVLVRRWVLRQGNAPVDKLNSQSRALVKASGQRAFYERICTALTQQEKAVFQRGRNTKSHTVAKHASVADYRIATGVEALFGYLYLMGEEERAEALFSLGLPQQNEKGKEE